MKHHRHASIRDILEHKAILSQDELRRELAGRGFLVTQATLSRDVHALNLYKGPAGYAAASVMNGEEEGPGIRDVLRSFGLEARQASNLLVVVTTTGGAQPIAASIDYEEWPEVLGTIAGDDTVLIICSDEKHATRLRARIEEHIG